MSHRTAVMVSMVTAQETRDVMIDVRHNLTSIVELSDGVRQVS